ncbi:hypothetical protein LXL04_004208 [Taraxacum kok-saghyz]
MEYKTLKKKGGWEYATGVLIGAVKQRTQFLLKLPLANVSSILMFGYNDITISFNSHIFFLAMVVWRVAL